MIRLLQAKHVFAFFLLIALLSVDGLQAQKSKLGIFDQSTDIGQCLLKGSSKYRLKTQEYFISGAGANIWSVQDAFHFLYKKMKGDFILQMEFEFQGQAKNQHRKVGWMVRNDVSAGSAHISGTVHNDGLTSLQYRLQQGGKTQELVSSAKAPTILQLERRGNLYIFSTAVQGQSLTGVEFRDSLKAINDEALVGIFLCSHEDNHLEKVKIRNVRITVPRNDVGKLVSNLELLDLESGHRRILRTSDQSIQAPNWTLDGKALIYNDQNGLMHRFNLQKQKAELIPTGFAVKNNNDHLLSFDGKLLGLSDCSEDPYGQSLIYVLPEKGGTPVRITEKAPSFLHGWSPDNKLMLFTGKREGDFDVYAIDTATKVETRLTNTPGLDDGPEYSPDGRYIYFNSVRSGKMQIWRMKPDGSEQVRITQDEFNNWFPHVSPDGKSIVYIAFGNDVAPGDHPMCKHVSIRRMNLETGEIQILVHLYGGQSTMNTPNWSPDGKKIAFVSNTMLNDWFQECY